MIVQSFRFYTAYFLVKQISNNNEIVSNAALVPILGQFQVLLVVKSKKNGKNLENIHKFFLISKLIEPRRQKVFQKFSYH